MTLLSSKKAVAFKFVESADMVLIGLGHDAGLKSAARALVEHWSEPAKLFVWYTVPVMQQARLGAFWEVHK